MSKSDVHCVIKLGGAAITIKDELETVNPTLEKTIQQIVTLINENKFKVILVHGAGSFGHFHAAEVGLHRGSTSGTAPASLLLGFSKTRLSVLQLNLLVVQALVKQGLPAVGMSPACSWVCRDRAVVADGCAQVQSLLDQGLIPVLHGDAVLDETLGVTVLGGDAIMATLCQYFKPHKAVFMVSRPPTSGCDLSRPPLAGILHWHVSCAHCFF